MEGEWKASGSLKRVAGNGDDLRKLVFFYGAYFVLPGHKVCGADCWPQIFPANRNSMTNTIENDFFISASKRD